MDTGGVEPKEDYIHEPEEERGGNDTNHLRGDRERTEREACENSNHRTQGQDTREYQRADEARGHHDRPQEVTGIESTVDCHPNSWKRRPRHRDIRHTNYAFSGPHEDAAAKEAQEWLDNLSIAGGEEENNPLKIWPKGQKYRTGTTNESPQMQERLQRCEQDQETHDYRIHIPRLEKRNESPDIYPVLHVEENQNKHNGTFPLKLWGNTRRSCVGNTSASVYAVMHPGPENRLKVKHVPPSQQE